MTSHFTVELHMREPPGEALARAAAALEQPAHDVGLKLARRRSARLDYRPRPRMYFSLRVWHYVRGEHMTVSFDPGASGGTRVRIVGSVAGSKHAQAADPLHWARALGGPGAT